MKSIKISSECKVINYVKDMGIPILKKKDLDMALEGKKKYNWSLYIKGRNQRVILVRISDKTFFRVEMDKKIPILDLKISLNYLLNHNGTGYLNGLCFSENCKLKDSSRCTMKLLRQFS